MKRNQLRLRVMAEYGSSGIWVIGTKGVWRHGMIEHSSLRLPKELSAKFVEWIEEYYQILTDENFDKESFNKRGRELAQELKNIVGDEVYVEFIPEENNETGLGQPEEFFVQSDRQAN